LITYTKNNHLTINCSGVALSKWSEIKHGVSQVSIIRPVVFLLHISDLPTIINNESILTLFVKDTSIWFTLSKPTDFNIHTHKVFEISNKWFKAN
jgi:hypothetical protein